MHIDRSKAFTILALCAAVGFTLIIGWQLGAIGGSPAGCDASAHLAKIEYILKYFPHFTWNYLWDSGGALFGTSYPPLSYYLCVLLCAATKCSPAASLNFWATFSFCLNSAAIFGFIYNITRNRLAALFAVMLMVSMPAYWTWWVVAGTYPRLIGVGFLGLSLYVASLHTTRPKVHLALRVGLVLSLTFAMCCHLISGAIALGGVLLYLLIASRKGERGRNVAWAIFPTIGLSAFYLLPLLFSHGGGVQFGGGVIHYQPAPWQWFFHPVAGLPVALSQLFLPLFVVLALAAIYLWRAKGHGFYSRDAKAGFIASTVIGVIFLGYAVVGHIPGYPDDLYINGFTPGSGLFVASIGLSIAIAILLAQVWGYFAPRWRQVVMTASSASLIGVCIALCFITGFVPPHPENLNCCP
jgi:uncharacterized membrane protein